MNTVYQVYSEIIQYAYNMDIYILNRNYKYKYKNLEYEF